MATRAQIIQVRLTINDPASVIAVIDIANSAALPAAPRKQTAYYTEDAGKYFTTEVLTGAAEADYTEPELFLADDTIETIVDAYGLDSSYYRCLLLIAAKIAQKMPAVRIANGEDSTEYNALRDQMSFYKDLMKAFKEQKAENANAQSGSFNSFRRPRIAGGNL